MRNKINYLSGSIRLKTQFCCNHSDRKNASVSLKMRGGEFNVVPAYQDFFFSSK